LLLEKERVAAVTAQDTSAIKDGIEDAKNLIGVETVFSIF